ncbi:hypothetical protein GCM10027085_16270 [Spirosoma aerophilum]
MILLYCKNSQRLEETYSEVYELVAINANKRHMAYARFSRTALQVKWLTFCIYVIKYIIPLVTYGIVFYET